MAIHPIEMQVLLPKATEVSRIQQNRDELPQNNQHLLSNEEQKKAEIKQEQVQTTEQLNNLKVNRDGHNKDQKKQKGKAKQTEEESEKPKDAEAVDPVRGHNLDLKL